MSDPVKCACRSDDAFRCVELRHPEIYARHCDDVDPPDCEESCECSCHSEWWNEVYYADEELNTGQRNRAAGVGGYMKPEIIELPNGSWVRADVVTGIALLRADLGHGPCVTIWECGNLFACIHFDNFEAARTWASEFAQRCNRSSGWAPDGQVVVGNLIPAVPA